MAATAEAREAQVLGSQAAWAEGQEATARAAAMAAKARDASLASLWRCRWRRWPRR